MSDIIDAKLAYYKLFTKHSSSLFYRTSIVYCMKVSTSRIIHLQVT